MAATSNTPTRCFLSFGQNRDSPPRLGAGADHILSFWGVVPGCVRPDISLCGSPERCAGRWAVEDAGGRVFVLEQLQPGQETRRWRIAALLDTLAKTCPWANPYLTTRQGDAVLVHESGCWQLSLYIDNEPLDRPGYLRNAGMGASLGRALDQLCEASVQLDGLAMNEQPDLHAYVRTLLPRIAAHSPAVFPRAQAVYEGLDAFWRELPALPYSFCHGDVHPVNVLWRGGEVAALIDWEFCGLRPRLYDLANCLGCVGVEDPRALGGEFSRALLDGVRTRLLQGPGALFLPELALALRFAWLSEWLRRSDADMVSLELDYMELLARKRDALREVWELPAGLW